MKTITKIIAVLTIVAMLLFASSCGANSTDDSTQDTKTVSVDTSSDTGDPDTSDNSDDTSSSSIVNDYFADGDYKDVTEETPDATITLSGTSGEISDTTRGSSGSDVTITSKGVYRVTGTSEDVSIIVNDETESGNIYIVLDGVTMTNSSSPCIIVECADKVIIQSSGECSLTYTASSSDLDGAIYSSDDIVLNGDGNLTITSSLHGIVGKDDVKITGAVITIDSDSIGIKANDSVRIGGGVIDITSGHDGIQVSNSDGDSYFYIESGTLTIDAGYDGIDVGCDGTDVSVNILMAGGAIDVTAGGGSSESKNSSTSQKGVKCDGEIVINDAAILTVSSADDAIHSSSDVTIAGGEITLSSSDDGIHADNELTKCGGSVTVEKSYEGLEAYAVTINDGDVSITSSDDGINAAGGSDSSSSESLPTFWASSSSTGTLNINGGYLYVSAQGDGLDSNGSLYVTGGTVIVEGPTDNDNGAIDVGDGNGCTASITGGTVLAIGSTGMAVNFDSGTQCSALVTLSGSAGDTISVDDGSGFSFKTSKAFSCAVYSSASMTSGNTYTISTSSSDATMDFSSGLYYSNVSSMGGGMGGPGGMR